MQTVVVSRNFYKFAPCKKKYARGNNTYFMNKFLTKAHMKRSRLRNLYLKKKTGTSRIAYIKQRSYCVSPLRKTKKDLSNSGGLLNHYFQIK